MDEIKFLRYHWNLLELKLMDSGLIVYQNGLLHNSSEFLEQMFQDGWVAW